MQHTPKVGMTTIALSNDSASAYSVKVSKITDEAIFGSFVILRIESGAGVNLQQGYEGEFMRSEFEFR